LLLKCHNFDAFLMEFMYNIHKAGCRVKEIRRISASWAVKNRIGG